MMKQWSPKGILLILLPLLLILPGCWDNRDFSKLLFVSAIGIDKAKTGQIELTLQIIKPKPNKSNQEGKGNSESQVWVESFTGETVMDAVRNALSLTNRQPNYSQTLLLVIGEDLAKLGIMEALDLCTRDHEIQKKLRILVAKGTTAKNILNAKSSLEAIPAVHIAEVLDNEAASPKRRNVELFDVLKALAAPGINPTLGVIEPPEQNNKNNDIKVSGTAAFKQDKLIGYLDEDQTMGLLFILDKLKGGVLNIPHPLDQSKKLTVEIKSSTTVIDITGYNEEPVFKIKVNLEGNIADAEGVPGILDQENISLVERETSDKIAALLEETVKYTQENLNTDIFGFGKRIWEQDPQSWSEIKDWDNTFSQAQIQIEVQAKVRSPGLTMKPIKPQ